MLNTAAVADDFVKSILDDTAPLVASPSTKRSAGAHDSSRELTEIQRDGYGAEDNVDESSEGELSDRAYAMFRYALLFVNFTFVVAALLMIMAGVVARFNAAVSLCAQCGQLTLASIILGALMWLLALFAFNWIRQRNILFLLGYVAAVLIITVALIAIFIAGIVFDINIDNEGHRLFLPQWERDVNRNDTQTGESPLCRFQATHNCSGFYFGCCQPGVCYNETDPESWVSQVCPECRLAPASQMCTEALVSTARHNLGGFVVITFFSILLAVTGIAMAAFARTMNS